MCTITASQQPKLFRFSTFTYVVDGVNICLGKDEFLEGSTVAVPRSLMYCCVAMLHSPNTVTDMITNNCTYVLDNAINFSYFSAV